MAGGAGFLAAIFFGSRFLRLDTVNWLIRNFLGSIVFAIIVLFQADIRRALAHLGRAPFFRLFAREESREESIEELVVAAGLMSAQHIGAIIAVERQVGMRNYIDGGISLDAVLTYDLLLAIFQPKSPLHDGAVIVQNDRVAAAIGLTEENDAVAIVVSEETGVISVVVDGQIERGFDVNTLRARLRALILH